MIFYFTGTGNSLYIAERIAAHMQTELISIAEIMKGKTFMLTENEPVGFVFPIYAWAPPGMVTRLIRQHTFGGGYTFAICTCGDEAGLGMEKLQKALGKKLDCAYSISMPNNYIVGFDVDPKDVEARKLQDAEETLKEIYAAVDTRQNIWHVERGRAAGLKSTLIAPIFNVFATSARSFRAKDTCTGCKRCEQVCPTANIMANPTPVWGKDCTGCLACIHHCPVHAIEYGKSTEQKGRYVNPNCTVEYHF